MKGLKHNIGFKILLIVYIIFFILDLGSTILNNNILQAVELNPVYKYIGIIGIIVSNILVILSFYSIYTRTNIISRRFIIITGMVNIIFGRVIAIKRAIEWYSIRDNINLELLNSVMTPAVKQAAITEFLIILLKPYIICVLCYIVFSIDHDIIIKEKEN